MLKLAVCKDWIVKPGNKPDFGTPGTPWQKLTPSQQQARSAYTHAYQNTSVPTVSDVAQLISAGYSITAQHTGGINCRKKEPHTCYGSHRLQDNFMAFSFTGFDADKARSMEHLLDDPFIAEYYALIYTTVSSTPDDFRARVFFRFETTNTSGQYQRETQCVWIDKYEDIAGADPSCKDPCRNWYGSLGCDYVVNEDKYIPAALMAELTADWRERNAPRPKVIAIPKNFTGNTPYALAALESECNKIVGIPHGKRYHALFGNGAAMGELIAGGELDEFEATSQLINTASFAFPDCNIKVIQSAIYNGIERGKSQPRTAPTIPPAYLHFAGTPAQTTEEQDPYLPEQETPAMEAEANQPHYQTYPSPQPPRNKPVELPKILTVAELANLELKPPSFLVDQLLPDTGTAAVGGAAGIGKSMLLMNMAIALATGGLFLGKYQCKQAGVLYLSLESHERRDQFRFNLMLRNQPKPSNLYIAWDWQRFGNKKDGEGNRPLPESERGMEQLDAFLAEHPDVKVIIVDIYQSVRPVGRPVKGDAYLTEAELLDPIRRYCFDKGIAIVFSHHKNKGNWEFGNDAFSGSTGFQAKMNTKFMLKQEGNQESEDDRNFTLDINGNDIDHQKISLTFDPDLFLFQYKGEAKEVAFSKERQDIIDLLSLPDFANGAEPRQIAQELGVKGGTIRKRIHDMVKDNQLISDNGRYKLVGLSNTSKVTHQADEDLLANMLGEGTGVTQTDEALPADENVSNATLGYGEAVNTASVTALLRYSEFSNLENQVTVGTITPPTISKGVLALASPAVQNDIRCRYYLTSVNQTNTAEGLIKLKMGLTKDMHNHPNYKELHDLTVQKLAQIQAVPF